MSQRIKRELSVGVTQQISDALEAASEFSGLKQSQIGRLALMEKLCRDGFMRHPSFNYQNSHDGK